MPPFHVVAGNPARIIRKIETKMDPEYKPSKASPETEGAEVPMAQLAHKDEKSQGSTFIQD